MESILSFSSMLKKMEIAVDLMVLHLSCSSFLVSLTRVSLVLDAAMIPALAVKTEKKR